MASDSAPASENLERVARRLRATTLAELFAQGPDRASALTFDWNDWRLDISKERVDQPLLEALLRVAEASNLPHWIAALFAGEKINVSEHRPVLHTALRAPASTSVVVDGVDVTAAMRATRERMSTITSAIREGRRKGATGRPIRFVVNIGIGGSDLGPKLVCEALEASDDDVRGGAPGVAFVSNVDPEHLSRALSNHDPAATLFIVTSKTFTTQETLTNAQSARAWLRRALGEERDLSPHFLAVTSNVDAAVRFGVRAEDVLPMSEGVGGRYSLWSSVGLVIAVRAGWRAYCDLLDGAQAMDTHFRMAPLERNLPVILGLLTYWNARFLDHRQRVVIPYAEALARLPAYLQQLSLESNGKRVRRDGTPVDGPTAPGLWGDVGTNSQHAFFQWLHQGTHEIPVEFIVPVRARHPLGNQQKLLVANALAQAQALMIGRGEDELRRELSQRGLSATDLDAAIAARVCPGNRASTTLLMPTLDARNLGALLALYEHRTFVEGVLYGINSFDQWGVELGKTLAKPIAAALEDNAPLPDGTDASTRALVVHARDLFERS
ncbi:MAG TPA: glucose-6-phosphate isomerase [Casimicrobiaceae bacterium]|nr:glucose-6-phosphate isomerase [Casimicrobiaceae bacterium]